MVCIFFKLKSISTIINNIFFGEEQWLKNAKLLIKMTKYTIPVIQQLFSHEDKMLY